MRRFSTVFLVLLLSFAAAFAANSQKIYSVDTDIYRTISQIYVLTGHALPSTTGPWSADELLSMYEAIDRNDVPAYMQQKYDNALAELTDGEGVMKFSGTINTELYVHTYDVQAADAYSRTDVNGLTDHAFEGRSWWFAKDLNHITPFFNLEWETWLADHFYTAFDFGLQNAFRGAEYRELGSTALNTNIIMLQNLKFDLKGLDIASFPHRAFAAFGGSGWSVEAGRDRLNFINEYQTDDNSLTMIPPTAQFKAHAGIGLMLGADVIVMKLAGPKIAIGPKLTADAELRLNQDVDQCYFKSSVDVGFVGEVGAKLKIWKWELGDISQDFTFGDPYNIFHYNFPHEKDDDRNGNLDRVMKLLMPFKN